MRNTMILCLRNLAVSLAFVVLLTGCATERAIPPSISASPRTGLDVSPPIIASVFDGRSTNENEDAAEILQADLSRIYGPSLEWTGYFAKTPEDRVAV